MKIFRLSTLLYAGSLFAVAACQPVTSRPELPTLIEHKIPTHAAHANGITVGSDGAIWFAESGANQIGRITVDGEVTEYPIPSEDAVEDRQGFVGLGPDGAIWFNEDLVNKIGRITPDGTITEFALPQGTGYIRQIVAGKDGALWLTATEANKILKLSTEGEVLAEYPLPVPNSLPAGMVAGPDGAFWFIERGANQVGRITLEGEITEYPIPTADSAPIRLAVGPDNALWFAEIGANKIGRISLDGEITEFDAPDMGPLGLAAGADGAIWFTGYNSTEIGRLTPQGELTRLSIPTYAAVPYHIVAGPDGNLWFTEQQGNKIGQIKLPKEAASAAAGVSSSQFKLPLTFAVNADWSLIEDYVDLVTVRHHPTATELAFNMVTTAEVTDPVNPTEKPVPFPEDFIRWIQEDPDFATGEPTPVTVAGYPGVQIDGTPTWTSSTAHKKPFLRLKSSGWNLVTDPEKWRFVMLNNVAGERLLILQISSREDFDQGAEAAEAVLKTLKIIPGK